MKSDNNMKEGFSRDVVRETIQRSDGPATIGITQNTSIEDSVRTRAVDVILHNPVYESIGSTRQRERLVK